MNIHTETELVQLYARARDSDNDALAFRILSYMDAKKLDDDITLQDLTDDQLQQLYRACYAARDGESGDVGEGSH